MNHMTDEEIASQVQKGGTESFGVLVERYEPKMRRYGRKFMSNGQDIEDIVQDIFIKAYKNIQSFDAGMSFSPWIYRVAHNTFVNALKKNSRMPLSLFDFDTIFPQPVAPETADGEADRQSTKKILDACLDKLGMKYREPLVLYYFEEMSYPEIAEILRIPLSTAGVRLNRGKTMLKKIFKEKYPNYETGQG